jgi:hypothetical protein
MISKPIPHNTEIPGAAEHTVDDEEYLKPIFNVVSVDLGFADDFTAISAGTLYNRIIVPGFGEKRDDGKEIVIRFQDRWRQVPYPETIERIMRILSNIPAMEKPVQTYLILDTGGCGLPVYHELRKILYKSKSATYIRGYQITGGESAHEENGIYYTPKKDIIGSLIYAAETGLLKLAGDLKTRDALSDEWQKFTRKRRESGTESFEAGTGHDDLISSLGFLCNFCVQRKDVTAISLKNLHPVPKENVIPSRELIRFELSGFEQLRSGNG